MTRYIKIAEYLLYHRLSVIKKILRSRIYPRENDYVKDCIGFRRYRSKSKVVLRKESCRIDSHLPGAK